MLVDESEVRRVVHRLLAAANAQLPVDRRLALAPDTILVGSGGGLDSLAIVNLLVSMEDAIDEEFGQRITLLNDALLADSDGALHTVSRLVEYIARALSTGQP